MKKKIIIALFFVFISSMLFAQTTERKRGFYFDIGMGLFGRISYDDELDDALELLEKLGAERLTISLGLAAGGAITQNIYIVGSISAFGDRFDINSNYMQLNTYLLGAGIRYYPLPSMKWLQIGADYGISWLVLTTDVIGEQVAVSDFGTGLRLSVSCDFNGRMTGPSFLLGGELLISTIESDLVAGISLFGKLVFK